MLTTKALFDGKKIEIEFYFRVMCDITGHKPLSETDDKLVLQNKLQMKLKSSLKIIFFEMRLKNSNEMTFAYTL